MHGAAARARDVERLRDDVAQGALVELVAVDHRDAELLRAAPVGVRIREVGDADLHDAARVEPGFDQAAHGGAVAAAVAQIVVGVQRDEPGVRQSRPGHAERRRHGERVVAAERHDQLRSRREPFDGRGRLLLAALVVGVCAVAGVDDAQRLVEHDLRLRAAAVARGDRDDVARIALQRRAHRCGGLVRVRRGERGAPGRHADEREVDPFVVAGSGPGSGARPGRIVRQCGGHKRLLVLDRAATSVQGPTGAMQLRAGLRVRNPGCAPRPGSRTRDARRRWSGRRACDGIEA